MAKEYTEKLLRVVETLENIEGIVRECRQEIQLELREIMHKSLLDLEA